MGGRQLSKTKQNNNRRLVVCVNYVLHHDLKGVDHVTDDGSERLLVFSGPAGSSLCIAISYLVKKHIIQSKMAKTPYSES